MLTELCCTSTAVNALLDEESLIETLAGEDTLNWNSAPSTIVQLLLNKFVKLTAPVLLNMLIGCSRAVQLLSLMLLK